MFVCCLRLYFDGFWLFKLPIFKQSFKYFFKCLFFFQPLFFMYFFKYLFFKSLFFFLSVSFFFECLFFFSALSFLFPIFKRFSQLFCEPHSQFLNFSFPKVFSNFFSSDFSGLFFFEEKMTRHFKLLSIKEIKLLQNLKQRKNHCQKIQRANFF
ncbi:hypothetical protein BD560DRAFT_95629 [Blakeslea trispora]|nr:hypothetical protein BD560DRAFT_95629 [Blakeslea trispora]